MADDLIGRIIRPRKRIARDVQVTSMPPNPHGPAINPWTPWRCPAIRWGIRSGPGVTIGCDAAIDEFADEICRTLNFETGKCEKFRDAIKSGATGDELAALLAEFPELGPILPDVLAAIGEGAINYGVAWPEAKPPGTKPMATQPRGGVIVSRALLFSYTNDVFGNWRGEVVQGPARILGIAWSYNHTGQYAGGSLKLSVDGYGPLVDLPGTVSVQGAMSLALGAGVYIPAEQSICARIEAALLSGSQAPIDAAVHVAVQPLQ